MSRSLSPSRATSDRQSAFTLVELLVAVAVMGILGSTIIGFLGNFLQLKFRTETRLRMREEGQYALDRIEYLVRNGITLPDICGQGSGSSWTELKDVSGCSGGCTNPASGTISTIKVNLRGENLSNDYIHRMRVFAFNNQLYEVSTYPKCGSTSCNHSAVSNSALVSAPSTYNLTRSNPGSTGNSNFVVSDFEVTCTYDPNFLNGYSVNVQFDIAYKRNSLNGIDPADYIEHFSRDIAVRNDVKFQN